MLENLTAGAVKAAMKVAGAGSWGANPVVWVIGFSVEKVKFPV